MFDLDARWWLVVSFTFGIRTVAFDYISCYIDVAVTGLLSKQSLLAY